MVVFKVLLASAAFIGHVKGDQHPYRQYQPAPASYRYDWNVVDTYSGNDFGAEEARTGYKADGGYTVLLPDGRKQIVTYRVDDAHSGYIADVRYEGEAQPYQHPPGYVPFTVHTVQPKSGYGKPTTYHPAPTPYVPPKPTPAYVAPAKPPVTYGPQPAVPAYKPAYVPHKPAYKPYVPAVSAYQPTKPVYTFHTTTPLPVEAPVTTVVTEAPATTTTAAAPTTTTVVTTEAATRPSYKAQYSGNAISLGGLFYGDLGRIRAEKKSKEKHHEA